MSSRKPDPLLLSGEWARIRRFWIALGLPCARCGLPIDYVSPRNPASLVVGHIVGRDLARSMGWSDDRINARSNTQPEHSRCSSASGATYGNRKRGQRVRSAPRPAPVVCLEPLRTSREW
jgi:hypothetical protein